MSGSSDELPAPGAQVEHDGCETIDECGGVRDRLDRARPIGMRHDQLVRDRLGAAHDLAPELTTIFREHPDHSDSLLEQIRGVHGRAEQSGFGVEDDLHRNPLDQRTHGALVPERVEEPAVSQRRQDLRRDAAAHE